MEDPCLPSPERRMDLGRRSRRTHPSGTSVKNGLPPVRPAGALGSSIGRLRRGPRPPPDRRPCPAVPAPPTLGGCSRPRRPDASRGGWRSSQTSQTQDLGEILCLRCGSGSVFGTGSHALRWAPPAFAEDPAVSTDAARTGGAPRQRMKKRSRFTPSRPQPSWLPPHPLCPR